MSLKGGKTKLNADEIITYISLNFYRKLIYLLCWFPISSLGTSGWCVFHGNKKNDEENERKVSYKWLKGNFILIVRNGNFPVNFQKNNILIFYHEEAL
jgi:hypothetical protein